MKRRHFRLRNPSHPVRRRAQSLVAALILLAFVTALFGSMAMGLFLEAGLAAGQNERIAAFYLARAGIETAAAELLAHEAETHFVADPWRDNSEAFSGRAMGPGNFDVRHRRPEDGRFAFGAVDEESKVNINKASGAMLEALHPAFTREAVYATLNFRLQRPFRTVSELEALDILPPGTLRQSPPQGGGVLADLLTVFGDGRVNVNTASPTVLACLPGVTRQEAEAFAAWREEHGEAVADLEEAAQRLAVGAERIDEFLQRTRTDSEHFTATSTGRIPDSPGTTAEVRQVMRRTDDGLVVLEFEQLR